jgi:riboflavin kinase/FMN adenylyltransferase
MKVFRGRPKQPFRTPCVLAIGNFDGVHRGHQAMLARVRELANQYHLVAAAMTFEPHPREFFAKIQKTPTLAPNRVSNLRDKLEALKNNHLDLVIVERFNHDFSRLSHDDFVKQILVEGLHVQHLVLGEDFQYGAQRTGNLTTLHAAATQYGFTIHTLPTVTHHDIRISSSLLRQALSKGDFAKAHEMTGRSYTISGRVIHGQKLGRELGFPTLNLRIAHHRPALHGIYVVNVYGLNQTPLPAVASIGKRPSVGQQENNVLEIHIFNFNQECYGQLVQIEFLQKLRDEEKYADLPTLQKAIQEDIQNAQNYFLAHSL